MTHERELTSPIALCDAHGRLDPDAIGWARRPLVRANLSGHRGRKKRWNHWCVTTPTHVLTATLADIDWLGLAAVALLDRATGEERQAFWPLPLAAGLRLPDHPLAGARLHMPGLSIDLEPEGSSTRLRVNARRFHADILAVRDPGQESLDVVVPFADHRFQLTSKHVGLPARGRLVIDGVVHPVGEGAFACLDFGRGVWPYRTAWNWAVAAGVVDGKIVSFNLGGQWTRGSGMTENALFVGGALTKLGDEIEFTPGATWTLASPAVSLRVEPEHHRRMGLELGLMAARLRLVWGRFHGTICGQPIPGLYGWAEEVHARW